MPIDQNNVRLNGLQLKGNVNALLELVRPIAKHNGSQKDYEAAEVIDAQVKRLVDANERWQRDFGRR
jgi:hypothetical protein